MSSEVAISARGLSKAYHIYRRPIDRLWQMLWRGRRKFYDEYWALKDVSMEVHRGETVGIIGRNGSGKSTFLQIVAGTLSASEGEIAINGRIAALLELGAGFNPEFTGRENVYLAASVLGLTEDQIDQRFESIASFASIGDFIEQPVKLYSSGMYARLAFAVAAHVDADILVIDEILAVGDAAFTQKCMAFIRRFKERGTIFFVSHDAGSIVNLCDRVVWLDNGKVREEGVPKEVARNYTAAIYGEKEDGGSFRIGGRRRELPRIEGIVEDHRKEILEESNVKNVIDVFDFDPNAPWFGHRGATIKDVRLLNEDGDPLTMLLGGEAVLLEVHAESHRDMKRPIIGFYVKDKLGQELFGDNTYLTYSEAPVSVTAGEYLVARFAFQMPFLPSGDFSVTTAIAEGTMEDHVHHHWIDDVLFFRVQSSHVARGLIGVPILEIQLFPTERLESPDQIAELGS